jgi:hypothetical protein
VFSIRRCELPAQALHTRYRTEGAYVDCYTTVVRGAISHAQFVAAFYKTWLFKLERLLLFVALGKGSTDEQVHRLVSGEANVFAAWTVEGRAENQLLMCDFKGQTRSWLMVVLEDWDGDVVTRLYFGSVVVPGVSKETGVRELSNTFKVLLPFHKLYSRALLAAARFRIKNAR